MDLEAIHEHFKVCLADPAPDVGDGSSAGGAAKGASQEIPPKAIKKRRMVGTSVKGSRSSSSGSRK